MGLLLNSQAQPVQPAQQPAQQQPQGKPAELPPEQQQQVDLGVKQATDFILQYENAEQLATMAETTDPVTAIVDMGLPVLNTIYSAARDGGHELPPEVTASIGYNVAFVMASVLALAEVIGKEEIEPLARKAYVAALEKHNQGAGQQPAQQQPAPQAQQAGV